jgi:hypothetical protein
MSIFDSDAASGSVNHLFAGKLTLIEVFMPIVISGSSYVISISTIKLSFVCREMISLKCGDDVPILISVILIGPCGY